MKVGPLTHEEAYCLDVTGYLIARNALTQEEVTACNRAIDQVGGSDGMLEWGAPWRDPFIALQEHPVLTRYLEQICFGQKFRLNRPPRLISDRTVEPMSGGNEPRNWSRSYFHIQETRFVQGLLVLWALTDVNQGEGGFTLVPGTHKSSVETPADILQGSNDLGLPIQPTLKAGDLLLCTETVLHGVRPWMGNGPLRLLRYGYIGELVRRSNSAPIQEGDRVDPVWVDEMSPEQRIVMGVDRPNPAPIVHSDGKRCWVDDDPGTYHPSILIRDPDSPIDEKEFYHWDLCGHLVLRGVMDEEWLAAANKAIDVHSDVIEKGEELSRGSKRLAGTGLSSLKGLFELPNPHSVPFRRMIANPAVVERMNWMSGSGFVLDAERAIIYEKGSSGHSMHSGTVPSTPRNHYVLQNGRSYCETINVAWQLVDVNAGDGGFVCIPGSHKCHYPLPDGVRSMEDDRGLVKHVEMQAGDVVLFMGSAQIHGAYPWMNDTPRRAVIVNYVSRSLDQPPRRF